MVLVKVRRNFDIEESALSLGLNDGETHDLFSLKGLEVEPPEPSAPFGDQELVRGDKGHPPRMVKLLLSVSTLRTPCDDLILVAKEEVPRLSNAPR